jgi:hypothetical protein
MAKIDVLREKYPKVTKTTANLFLNGDKTPTKKYLEYMFKIWANKPPYFGWTGNQLVKFVNEFDDLLPYIENKDIYHKEYESVSHLSLVIEKAKKTKEEREFVREEHIDVLIENDDYLLLRPITLKGSMKYGYDTRWCTTQSNGYQFKTYTNKSYLFYLVSKKERSKNYNKVAFFLENKNDTLTGGINIYNQLDTNIEQDIKLLSYGWSMFEIFEITTKIRSYSFEDSCKLKIKEEVDSTITKLENIDIDKFFKNVDLLNNYEDTGTEYKEKLNSILDKLRSKLSINN